MNAKQLLMGGFREGTN